VQHDRRNLDHRLFRERDLKVIEGRIACRRAMSGAFGGTYGSNPVPSSGESVSAGQFREGMRKVPLFAPMCA
jgi:hypothetical protein